MASLTPLLASFGANELQFLSSYGDSRIYEADEMLIREVPRQQAAMNPRIVQSL